MSKNRGVYFRDGAWWIRYADSTGRIRREKSGSKAEVLKGVKLPETLRERPLLFGELIDDAIEHSKSATGKDDIAQ